MLTTSRVTYVALDFDVGAFIDASARPSTTLHENSSQLPERPSASRAAWHDEVSSVTCAHDPAVVEKPVVTVFPVGEVKAVSVRVVDPSASVLLPELQPARTSTPKMKDERRGRIVWFVSMKSPGIGWRSSPKPVACQAPHLRAAPPLRAALPCPMKAGLRGRRPGRVVVGATRGSGGAHHQPADVERRADEHE